MCPVSSANSKLDEAVVEDTIRFNEESFPLDASIKGRKRRFSVHNKDDNQGGIFSIKEKAQLERVLPTLFRTISRK